MSEEKEEIREAKFYEEGGPHLFCPYCEEKYSGWALKEKLGEIDTCDKCGHKFKIV